MTNSESTVAIIGTGTIGSTLAAEFAAGGQDFLLAGRDADEAGKIAADLGGHAEAVPVDEAVDGADVLVVAVWLDDFREFIAQYGPRLAGKVIVDPSNPVGPDGQGGYAADDAAGDLVAGLIRVAGFDPVRVGGLDQPVRIEMFGDLHEYGALGRVVTRTEALKAI